MPIQMPFGISGRQHSARMGGRGQAMSQDMLEAEERSSDGELYIYKSLFVAPHTPNPWGHVELVSKDAGIG